MNPKRRQNKKCLIFYQIVIVTIWMGVFCLTFNNRLVAQQSDLVLHLKSGDIVLSPGDLLHGKLVNKSSQSEETVKSGFIQFYKLPDQVTVHALETHGITLIEYIPENTFIARIQHSLSEEEFEKYSIRSIAPIEAEHKIHPDVISQYLDPNINDIEVLIQWHYPQSNLHELSEHVDLLKSTYIDNNRTLITIMKNDVYTLARLDIVRYIDRAPMVGEPEGQSYQQYHNAHILKSNTLNGKYDGNGVSILLRDDGNVSHIDFTGRVNNYANQYGGGNHGEQVAGVMVGAGIVNPSYVGVASGAQLYTVPYRSIFSDNTVDRHVNNDVMITNTSYGDGCNAGYTSSTQIIDQMTVDYPSMLHVFSAGNYNGIDCGYGAGGQWGNITGGHKQGKNVIAVANIYHDGKIASQSSRGPANDGRIKPDLAAVGQIITTTSNDDQYIVSNGTSISAPVVSGGAAQLYQAYKEFNNGVNPSSALIKATMLNSAKDLGQPGPDFKYGWGALNIKKAYDIISNNQYLSGSINNRQNRSYQIQIPAGLHKAKFMIYWTDKAGSILSNKALVNDIDFKIKAPNNQLYSPYVLNSQANPSTLDMAATTGVDHLNNMEQVSISRPAAGTYKLQVSGHTIPFPNQEFYIVWTFEKDELSLNFPVGNEKFIAQESQTIYWNTTDFSNDIKLEFSYNGGSTWFLIEDRINPNTNHYNWQVPQVSTHNGRIRVSQGTKSKINQYPFIITPAISGLTVTQTCRNGARLSWNPVITGNIYDIYKLERNKLEKFVSTTDTHFDFSYLSDTDPTWFAVAPRKVNMPAGKRSNAIKYTPSTHFNYCTHNIELTSTVSKQQIEAGERLTYNIKVKNHYPYTINSINLRDTIPNELIIVESKLGCGVIQNGVLNVNISSLAPNQIWTCSFKGDVALDSFTTYNYDQNTSDDILTWQAESIIGNEAWNFRSIHSGYPNGAWTITNNGNGNQLQRLSMPAVNISDGDYLYFRHKYATELYLDGGYLEISTNQGATWETFKLKDFIANPYNGALSVSSNTALTDKLAFTGNDNQYKTSIINLSRFKNHSAIISFVFGQDDDKYERGWTVGNISILNPFDIINNIELEYDQGSKLFTTLKTNILPCPNDCSSCTDNIQNYGETGIDCGGPCQPCPCTSNNLSRTFQDTIINNDLMEKIEHGIYTMGSMHINDPVGVMWQAGQEVAINDGFTVAKNAQLQINIEKCSTLDN